MVSILVLSVMGLLAVILLASSLFIVQEKEAKVVERLGKFDRIAYPGLNLKIPLIDSVVGTLDLRIQSLPVSVETKTKDNVFTELSISVQAEITDKQEANAFYKLQDPVGQIKTFIYDVVRSEVPALTLDELFEKKNEISESVQKSLKGSMDNFGYSILQTLVTDINPAQGVRDAMNRMESSKRLKIVAENEAAAEKTKAVAVAEAEKQSKILQGEGVAGQRKAIIDGLQESVEMFQKAIPGSKAEDIMKWVMMTNYFDTLKEIGTGGKVVFLPHSPGGLSTLSDEMRNAIISGNEVK